MLLGCVNYNLSLGYLLTFLLAGVGIELWLPVEAEEDQPQRRVLDDLEALRAGDARDVLQRHGGDHVDLAGKQGSNTGRVRLDRAELDALEIVLRLVPPAFVHRHHGLGIRGVALELERAGAVGMRSAMRVFAPATTSP